MTLAAGCGSSEPATSESDSADTSSPDTSAEQPEETTVALPDPSTPVVQMRTQAMFPITPPFLPTEWTTVAADGTVLVPFHGNFAVQPQVWPFEIGHVDVTRVEGLLAGADAAGLLDGPDRHLHEPVGRRWTAHDGHHHDGRPTGRARRRRTRIGRDRRVPSGAAGVRRRGRHARDGRDPPSPTTTPNGPSSSNPTRSTSSRSR